MGRMGGARHQASDYCLIVAEHADVKGAPLTPDCRCKHNWVALLPLDAPFQLGWCPAAIEQAVRTKDDGPQAVGEELEVRGSCPVWQAGGRKIGHSRE